MQTYINTLKEHSKELITLEGKVLVDLLLNVRDSTFNLSLIPFCALYCRSSKEFFNIVDKNNQIENEINDLRNGLKIFTNKYSKGKKITLESDFQQDNTFRNMLRFQIMKKYNFHLNLGVSFLVDGKIIFNTQLANYFLNIPKRTTQSSKMHALKIGENLGKEIASILTLHCNLTNLQEQTTFFNNIPAYGYIDYNTNKNNNFFNNEIDKEINLIILHMVSTIGFVNNLLIPVFKRKNEWLLRILYITVHNTWYGMKKVSQHIEQNNYKETIFSNLDNDFKKDTQLLSSTFRNCMMHYDLIDKNGQPSILEEWYNPNVPFFGLVESCYNGMSFDQLFNDLFVLSQKFENLLLSNFKINPNKIRWDWDN